MEPHQRRPTVTNLPFDQRQMLPPIYDITEHQRLQFATRERELALCYALHQNLIGQPVRHQIANMTHRQFVSVGELA